LIEADIPTETSWFSPEEAEIACGEEPGSFAHFSSPEEAKEPSVRVVNLGATSCPCAGTHVASTSELQGLKVIKMKAKKGKVKVSYVLEES